MLFNGSKKSFEEKCTAKGIRGASRAFLSYIQRYFCSGQRGQKIAVSVSRILGMRKMLSNMTSILGNNWDIQVTTDNNGIDVIPYLV